MSILISPGTPFYVNGTENCFFPNSTAPRVSDFAGVNATLVGGAANGTATPEQLLGEATNPTNSTLTAPFGDGGVLNNFFDTVDQAAKVMEVMKNVIAGTYITNTIDNFVVTCYYNETGHLVSAPEPQVWTDLKTGVQYLFIMLAIFTLFYWATGRGHILTS
jgi:hypothetical protein